MQDSVNLSNYSRINKRASHLRNVVAVLVTGA